MILGKIVGKTSTKNFAFKVENTAHKLEYVQIMHSSGDFVLGQIEEIEKDSERTVAFCNLIGYRDEEKKLQCIKSPLDPGIEVLRADDDFVKEILGLNEEKNSAYIGILDGRDHLKVHLDMNKILTKHVSVIAMSGSGKSYTVAVLLEELLQKKVPIVVIDPHGEYSSLKFPNDKDKEKSIKFGIEAKGFLKQIQEYSPDTKLNQDAKPLKLSYKELNSNELVHLLPTKLSSSQLGLVYSALKNLGGEVDFNDLIVELESIEDNNSKWALISIFEYVKKLNLFSENPTPMNELVQSNKMSIINLRGVVKEIQEVIVYKLINDLFMERKKGNIPPFFLVIEECHNFCPERSFGEAKSSSIIRQVAAEGRKFGLGLCLITQRPSRVEKSALAQASTQIIMRVTNPTDVKAVASNVEGITNCTEKEVNNIPVGSAFVTGIVDLPLLVNIRPRMSKHGGEAVNMFVTEEEKSFEEQAEEFEEKGDMLPVIKQKFTLNDVKLMYGNNTEIKYELVPSVFLKCKNRTGEFNLLIDLINLQVVENLEDVNGISLLKLDLQEINFKQDQILNLVIKMGDIKPNELFAKSGMQFSELYDCMNVLSRKGYFLKEGEEFKFSPSLSFLINMQIKQCYYPVAYSRVDGEKLIAKYQYQIIKDFLGKFFEILEVKECFVEKYTVIKNI